MRKPVPRKRKIRANANDGSSVALTDASLGLSEYRAASSKSGCVGWTAAWLVDLPSTVTDVSLYLYQNIHTVLRELDGDGCVIDMERYTFVEVWKVSALISSTPIRR
jgi:hypothetical protein